MSENEEKSLDPMLALSPDDMYSFANIEEAWGDVVPLPRANFDRFRVQLGKLREFYRKCSPVADPDAPVTERVVAISADAAYWKNQHAAALRVIDELRAANARGDGEVPQFHIRGCSDWYDGYPDTSDGKDWETRVLYSKPVSEVKS